MLLPLLSASATASAAPSAAGTSAARFLRQHRRQRERGAFAHRGDIEAEHRRRQQADIGERREAAADARIDDRASAPDAWPSRSRRPLRLPALAGSVRPRKISGMRGSRPAALSADSAAMVCISVSAVPPDFEMATKRVVACGSRASSVAEACADRDCP